MSDPVSDYFVGYDDGLDKARKEVSAKLDSLRELLGPRTVELAKRLVAPGSFPNISASEAHELSEAVLDAADLLRGEGGEDEAGE